MEPSNTSALWMFLLSGLAMVTLGTLFLWKPERRTAFFRAINPSIKPALAGKLSAGVLTTGFAMLLAFVFEVIPYPHSRPYAIVILSLILTPLATLGFTAIFLVAVFKRNN